MAMRICCALSTTSTTSSLPVYLCTRITSPY
jgi:hypothetical protein